MILNNHFFWYTYYGDTMDGFKLKFIKLSDKISRGEILTTELDKYVKSNCNKSIFRDAIIDLMDSDDYVVRILAARYSYDYDIDKKKSYSIARLILRREKSLVCRIEAKYIYDNHRRRHIRKITKLIFWKIW